MLRSRCPAPTLNLTLSLYPPLPLTLSLFLPRMLPLILYRESSIQHRASGRAGGCAR